MRHKQLAVLIGFIMAALTVVPLAFAATPDQIRQDLADGVLDGTYSQADLERASVNATFQGYGGPGAGDVEQGAVEQGGGVAAAGTLPFTGLDLALLVGGGLGLILLGLTLRRVVGTRSTPTA